MKILIIGSSGFIGSHIFQHFSTLTPFTCWGADITENSQHKNYFQFDGVQPNFNKLFDTVKFDVCINCSGAASVPYSLENTLQDFNLNVNNVLKILNTIKKVAPECKFINLSSAAVYGNPFQLPISEQDNCMPISPYGYHKLMSENICNEFYKCFGIGACSLRIFSAYGPGLKKQILWDISEKVKNNQQINLLGTGNESRDYIYISDIVQAVKCVIENGDFKATVYNIASGAETTIKEIISTLLQALNYTGELTFSGIVRKGDPLNWCADISKIKSIGFTPSVSINEGVSNYVRWLNEKK